MLPTTYQLATQPRTSLAIHTGSLLLLVARDGASDGVGLAANAVHSTLGVAFGLRGLGLSFTLGMLFFPGCLPRLEAGGVPDSLDERTFDRVELAGRFARSAGQHERAGEPRSTHLGSEDMLYM